MKTPHECQQLRLHVRGYWNQFYVAILLFWALILLNRTANVYSILAWTFTLTSATSAAIFCFTRAWLQMQTLLGYLALSSNFGGLHDSAVKIKQDFLGVIFCCPMEIVPPQMKIQCDRCVIFHSVSSSLRRLAKVFWALECIF